jgi:hypothetical protein
MLSPSWPPEDRYPIRDWTDDELIDQYRYVKATLATEDPDYLDTDENVAALIQEIIVRDLEGLAEATEGNPGEIGPATL